MEATASEKHIARWDEKTKAFFATDPKCKMCGGDFTHFSRTMVCSDCQKIKYRKTTRRCAREYREKNKEKVQQYQKEYYQKNKETISERKKIKYKEKKRGKNAN